MTWRGRTYLTLADLVTLLNGVLGFLAIIVAPENPALAARIILLAAITDGLDGVIARQRGGSPIGPYLDSLADVSSFALAPAVLVYVTLTGGTDWELISIEAFVVVVLASYVAVGILRLGYYSTFDTGATTTVGIPTTLAATIISAAILTVHVTDHVLLIGTAALALLMIAPINYPDLLARDVGIMGVIHVLAVLFPYAYGRIFPYALLTLALAYLMLAPSLYWGESERRLRTPESDKGKQS